MSIQRQPGQETLGRKQIIKDSRDGFGLLINEVARQWRLLLNQRLRPLGLTSARWAILVTLDLEGSLSQTELAQYIGVEAPSMVRQLDKLEKEGLVRRRPHPDDRRIKVVELTAEALPICDEICRLAIQLREDIFADIDDTCIHEAQLALTAIRERIAVLQDPTA